MSNEFLINFRFGGERLNPTSPHLVYMPLVVKICFECLLEFCIYARTIEDFYKIKYVFIIFKCILNFFDTAKLDDC